MEAYIAGGLVDLYDGFHVRRVEVDSIETVMCDGGGKRIEPALFVTGTVEKGNSEPEPDDWVLPLLNAPRAVYPTLGCPRAFAGTTRRSDHRSCPALDPSRSDIKRHAEDSDSTRDVSAPMPRTAPPHH